MSVPEGWVRTTAFVRVAGSAAIMVDLVDAGLATEEQDFLRPTFWDVGDDAVQKAPTWNALSWVQELVDADTLKAILDGKGPSNEPNGKTAYFRSDDIDVPAGGWKRAEMLANTDRKPALKAFDVLG